MRLGQFLAVLWLLTPLLVAGRSCFATSGGRS